MRQVPVRLWVFAVVSAVLQLLPFPLAGPVPEWRRLFSWICLTPLVYALLAVDKRGREVSASQGAALGYACGVVWYLGNCYWIYPTMHIYGALPGPVAAGILVLFALYLGLYHALFGWVVGWCGTRLSREVALVAAPLAWVSVELARARITGFPWDLLGYTQVDNLGLTKLAPVAGVMGLSLVVAVVNALWLGGVLLRGRAVRAGSMVVAGLVVIAASVLQLGSHTAREAVTQNAVLVQDNLSVGAEGGLRETRDQLLVSLDEWSHRPEVAAPASGASLQPPAVILWPEAPADFFDGDPVFRQSLSALAVSLHAPVIADSVGVAPAEKAGGPLREYNSASFFSAGGQYAGRYDKMHLVPFGEYTPYKQLFFFAGHLLDNVGGFTPGTQRTLFTTSGHSYGVFICYESIFGDEIRELADEGGNVLVNLSDDGWYGDSSAPWEHLDMVRMRAIENHRWVLRSTNTGVTTVIDPEGRVGPELPRHVRGALEAGFEFESGTTFYARHGDWLAWICAALALGAVLYGWARPRAATAEAIH